MSPRRLRVLAVLVVILAGGGLLAHRRAQRAVTRKPAVAGPPRFIRLPVGPSAPPLPTLSVCVKDARGPVAAAFVTVAPPPRSQDDRASLMGETGPDGCLSVAGMRAGQFLVTASDPGHAAAGQAVTVADRDVRIELALPAPSGWLLRGRVVDGGRGPVPGATVGTWLMEPKGALVQTRTDGSGRFGLRMPSKQADVFADAPGYAPTSELLIAGAAEVELTLKPGVVLAGRVVEKESGQPVAGAEVVAAEISFRATPRGLTLLTDEQGAFAFDRLAPGDYQLVAREGGRLARSLRVWTLGRGVRVSGATLKLAPACEVTGLVTGGGKPVPGASLGRADSPFLAASAAAVSDAAGRYRLTGLAETDVITVTAPGFAPARLWAEELCRQKQVDVSLERGFRLQGRVVDGQGSPAAGAVVAAYQVVHSIGMSGPMGGVRTTQADAQGRFQIDDLPGDGSVHVQAFDEEKGEATAGEVDPHAPLELRLASGGATVSGHVRYPDGQPVVGAVIYGRCGDHEDRTVAGGQGEYRLRRLGRGSGAVIANAPGLGSFIVSAFGPRHVAKVELTRDDQVLDGVDLVLPRRDRSVRGRVVDHRGQPVAGVGVFVSTDDPAAQGSLPMRMSGAEESTSTDLSGSFVIDGLPDATYTIWAHDAAYRESRAEQVTPSSRPITLTLSPPHEHPFEE